ncbi:MAG: CYTH domain-containing protein [Planctomycetota bacterium]
MSQPDAPETPLEIELKLLVDGPEALARLARAAEARGARASEPVSQVNHFFDSEDGLLRRTDRTVRVRREGERFRLTVKGALSDAGGGDAADLHTRPEVDVGLENERAEAVLRGELDPLALLREVAGRSALADRVEADLAGAPLCHSGSFRNERTRVGPLRVAGSELVLELDRTSFPGDRLDCEVELELPAAAVEGGRALLAELFAEAGIEGRPAEGKAKRFFRALANG